MRELHDIIAPAVAPAVAPVEARAGGGSAGRFAFKRYDEALEQERSLPGWEQRYSQLTPGRFEGSVACLSFPGLSILRERMNVAMEQLFAAPEDRILYFCLPRSAGAFHDEDRHLPGGSFGIGRGWSRLGISEANSDVIIVMAELDGFEPDLVPACGQMATGRSQPAADAMPEWLESLLEVYASGEAQRSSGLDALIPDLIRDRLSLILSRRSALEAAGAPCEARSARLLHRRGQDWLEAHPREPATVTRLARELGVAPGDLRRASLAVLGHPLDHVLLARRLGNARRDIVAARGTKRRISDIALDWGFAHWGRFSGAYGGLFGETPSETLRGRR